MGPTGSIIAVIFSLLGLLGAIGLVHQRNPVLATFLFVPVSISIGVVYLAMGAHLPGLVQILIFTPIIFYLLKKATNELPDPNIRRDPLPSIYSIAAITVIVLGLILFTDLGSVILAGTFGYRFSRGSFGDLVNIIQQYFSGWSYALLLILMLAVVLAVSLVHLGREKPKRKSRETGLGNEGDEA